MREQEQVLVNSLVVLLYSAEHPHGNDGHREVGSDGRMPPLTAVL